MMRSVLPLVGLSAVLSGCGSSGGSAPDNVNAQSYTALYSGGSGSGQSHRTFHVGYGTTRLPDAQTGDLVLCPHDGGAYVPDSGTGVGGNADFVAGAHGTIAWSVQWSGGQVEAQCRKR